MLFHRSDFLEMSISFVTAFKSEKGHIDKMITACHLKCYTLHLHTYIQ